MNFSKAKRSLITKLRLSCHILNTETMRYCRPKIVRHKRFCLFCPDSIESEEHFLLNCKKYDSKRKNNRFTSETIHVFGKGIDAVKHILNPQTKHQRTIGPENAHLKPDLGAFSHHEMTLTLNTHTPLLTSQVVCICKVSGLRLQ